MAVLKLGVLLRIRRVPAASFCIHAAGVWACRRATCRVWPPIRTVDTQVGNCFEPSGPVRPVRPLGRLGPRIAARCDPARCPNQVTRMGPRSAPSDGDGVGCGLVVGGEHQERGVRRIPWPRRDDSQRAPDRSSDLTSPKLKKTPRPLPCQRPARARRR